ncbi:MAG: hypothetical protein ACW7DO_11955, partial [Paraglaciecola chathamensis]
SELLQYAHSVEQYSEHPIARAFSSFPVFTQVEDFQFSLGEGVSAKVNQQYVELFAAHSAASKNANVPEQLKDSSIVMRI